MRPLLLGVAGVTLACALALPWSWGIEGAYFTRDTGAPAEAGVYAAWAQRGPSERWVGAVLIVVAALLSALAVGGPLGRRGRRAAWAVLAGAAVAVVLSAGWAPASGGPLVALCALALGAWGVRVPPARVRRPRPLAVALVVAGAALAAAGVWWAETQWETALAERDFDVDVWLPAGLVAAGAILAVAAGRVGRPGYP